MEDLGSQCTLIGNFPANQKPALKAKREIEPLFLFCWFSFARKEKSRIAFAEQYLVADHRVGTLCYIEWMQCLPKGFQNGIVRDGRRKVLIYIENGVEWIRGSGG